MHGKSVWNFLLVSLPIIAVRIRITAIAKRVASHRGTRCADSHTRPPYNLGRCHAQDHRRGQLAELRVGETSVEFPVVDGTENERAVDISKLRDRTGLISLDEGYRNTGSVRSAITFIDGENGILRYRGIPIEQLAEKLNVSLKRRCC